MDLRQLAQTLARTPAKVGQYGSDALFGGPQGTGRPIPFPFDQGLIAKIGRTNSLPKGSPARRKAEEELMMGAVMALSTGPVAASKTVTQPSLIHPIDKLPVQGSGEQILESGAGWKPGMKKDFDYALLNRDKNAVQKMISDVPKEYQKRFSTEIQSLLPEGQAPAGSPIAPDDMDTMEKVIDYVRLKQKPDPKMEIMANDLMDYYPHAFKTKGNQPKNMTEVANIFDKALQTLINKK